MTYNNDTKKPTVDKTALYNQYEQYGMGGSSANNAKAPVSAANSVNNTFGISGLGTANNAKTQASGASATSSPLDQFGNNAIGKAKDSITSGALGTAEETPAAEAAKAETAGATMYTPTTLSALSAANSNNPVSNTASTYAPAGYTPTGMYDPATLEAYNKQREADIRALYDAAHKNTLAGLKTAYDQNLSDANAYREQISPQYQSSMNALSAEYERQRRNNNMQAAANGLNTGAGSQMALAQSANYQANQAGLSAKENQALDEANRRIGDLKRNYQNAIAEATANNNYKLAASLLDEYQNAYNRQLQIENTNYQRAQQLEQQNYTRSWNEDERNYSRGLSEAQAKSQYGDFSGYRALYGDDIGNAMELTWAMQNPYVAYASGKLSAEDFKTLTGTDPNSVSGAAANGSAASGLAASESGRYTVGDPFDPTSGSGRIWVSSGRRDRGYSASRDKAYRGPAGYLNTDGQFVVPGTSYGAYENLTAADNHSGDADRAYDNIGVDYSPTMTWSEQLAKAWAGQ